MEIDGIVYHVQTETEGRSVSTNVFVDGAVVASRRSPIPVPTDDEELASQIVGQQRSTLKDLVGRRLEIRPPHPWAGVGSPTESPGEAWPVMPTPPILEDSDDRLQHQFECLLWSLRLQTFVDRTSLTHQLRSVGGRLVVILGKDGACEWIGRAHFQELSDSYAKIVRWLQATDDASRVEAVRLCHEVKRLSRRLLDLKRSRPQ